MPTVTLGDDVLKVGDYVYNGVKHGYVSNASFSTDSDIVTVRIVTFPPTDFVLEGTKVISSIAGLQRLGFKIPGVTAIKRSAVLAALDGYTPQEYLDIEKNRLARTKAGRRQCQLISCAKWVTTNRLSYCETCKGEICEDCDCGHNTWGA